MGLTFQAFEAALRRVTYKPNVTLVARQVHMRHALIECTAHELADSRGTGVVDIRTDSELLDLRRISSYDVIDAAKLAIAALESHEMKEWLRVDGELVEDPHAPSTLTQVVPSSA